MTINQHNSVLEAFSVPADRRRIDSSSIIAHPVNFDKQQERSLKGGAENST